MRYLILTLVCFIQQYASFAQIEMEAPPFNGGSQQIAVYYGAGASVKGVPYDKIKDSPFWFDQWQSASLYDRNNQLIGRKPVLLNLATGELYFLNGEKPLVAENDQVRKVVIHTDAVSENVKTVFLNNLPFLYVSGEKVNSYAQVFHSGPAILVKYIKKELALSEGGGGMPKHYYFKTITHYYLQVNGKAERLTKLSKDIILEQLPDALSLQGWVSENKLNLKKEEDVVKFIAYYNKVKESETK